MKHHMQLFSSKRFLPLFITQFLGAFNDNLFKNAFLIWCSYDMASKMGMDASMMVSLAAGLFILPFFLFSSLAGDVADKYDKSWLAQKIKSIEVLLMMLGTISFLAQSIEGLLVVLFFMGAQSTFFNPIKYSLLPGHLKAEELVSGNGFIGGGTFISILCGTICGGLVIRMEYGMEIVSICLISCAIMGWIASLSIPKPPIGDANLKIGWNIAKETWRIITYARYHSTIWLCILAISWFWLVGALFLMQFPMYTLEIIGGNEQVVTLFLAMFSIGICIGAICCNMFLKGRINGKLIPIGAVGMTIAMILFLVTSSFYRIKDQEKLVGIMEFLTMGVSSWGILLSLVMLAVCAGLYIVPLHTIMQHVAEENYIARVIASNNVMNALFMVLASIGSLLLFALGFTIIHLFMVVAIINALICVWLYRKKIYSKSY